MDRGKVEPGLLTGDLSVAELEDVEDPHVDRPALAVEQERRTVIQVGLRAVTSTTKSSP